MKQRGDEGQRSSNGLQMGILLDKSLASGSQREPGKGDDGRGEVFGDSFVVHGASDISVPQPEYNRMALAWAAAEIANIQVNLDRVRAWLAGVKL